MSNWTDYVKNYALKHNLSYGEALSKAAPSYRKSGGGVVLGGRKRRVGGSKVTRKKPRGAGMGKKPKKMPRGAGMGKKPKKMSMKHKQAYGLGRKVGKVLGGKAPKGALAALLSGLNATVKVE